MTAVLVLLLAGCNVVFPLRDEPVDAMPDSPPLDTPPPRCPDGNDATRMIVPAIADAMIASGVTTQNYGGNAVATISTDLGPQGSRGLFRFQVGALDPSKVLELRLVVPSAETSDDCGAGCGSCAAIERPGAMRAFPLINTWVESQATWARASTAAAWQQPGASGSLDRGGEMIAADHQVATETSFVATDLPSVLAWVANGQLSFVVESTGAKQVVRTRENVCDGGASGAQLEILSC